MPVAGRTVLWFDLICSSPCSAAALPSLVASSVSWPFSVLCCGSGDGECVDLIFVFFVLFSVSTTDHHTFTFGLGLMVYMRTSFMPSLSLSAYLYKFLTFTFGLDSPWYLT